MTNRRQTFISAGRSGGGCRPTPPRDPHRLPTAPEREAALIQDLSAGATLLRSPDRNIFKLILTPDRPGVIQKTILVDARAVEALVERRLIAWEAGPDFGWSVGRLNS